MEEVIVLEDTKVLVPNKEHQNFTETKEIIGDTLTNVKFSGLSWKNNDGFFYSSYDNPSQQNKSELSGIDIIRKIYIDFF